MRKKKPAKAKLGDKTATTPRAADLLGDERQPRVPFVGRGSHTYAELVQDPRVAERFAKLCVQAKQSFALIHVTNTSWNVICPIEDVGLVAELLEKAGQ